MKAPKTLPLPARSTKKTCIQSEEKSHRSKGRLHVCPSHIAAIRKHDGTAPFANASLKQPCETLSLENQQEIGLAMSGDLTAPVSTVCETQMIMLAAHRTGRYPRCRPLLNLLSCTDLLSGCLFQKMTCCGRYIVVLYGLMNMHLMCISA